MDKPVAIVTGAAMGIGRAIAEDLLKDGYKVCLGDINTERGRKTREELEIKYGKENVIFLTSDVSKESHVESLFEEALQHFKRVDVLVNNAGVFCEEELDRLLDINLKGPIYGCKMAFKYMGKDKGHNGGKVLNVASLAGLIGFVQGPIYTASKHGVVGLTRSYGQPEVLEKTGIIFNAICPSYVQTEIHEFKRPDLMRPEYVAEGALKLLKEEMNGATLVVTKFRGFEYLGVTEELEAVQDEINHPENFS